MPIEIRQAHPEDAPAIQLIYTPIVAGTAISFEEVPPTIKEMRQRIVTTLQNYPYLVAERDGRLVGYAYASQHRARAAYRWAVDVTVYIADGERRSGIGRSLYAELLPLLAKQGFNAAYAGIALPNAGSVGLHERLGFRHIGTFPQVGFKLGQWHDVGYWRLELCAPSNSPSDPRRYPEINR
ncbi:arsinothricin resistance N-acetyltransferase ArsN1 family B [Pseudomonas aeruginosa]|uniref:Phosphinothricin N-acetyltransferase n=1 Tax=Pseudomonas fluorescens TaxID=294 RepID=A0A3S4MLY8_PSEFL|nr:arsinothricin resistance N-acetyltransferase ArsN1 family B [Pseudomonas aeruginosa]VEE48332.1 phosphinothricin N-acetyltransferase [Pseudomonas fluorescens]EIU4876500.1 N-acetyltransferase [Pseudomonas aeruginosa]MBG5629279.1 N-acetyltransferase [Pseudomonas aeruginosa]MBI8070642.1 N-acetyltransferase [Pseudomonas aeruginosa]MBX6941065.1 N-acetyltransferase [Pseudomonas aeruginosa]